jgi:hypothetical protein
MGRLFIALLITIGGLACSVSKKVAITTQTLPSNTEIPAIADQQPKSAPLADTVPPPVFKIDTIFRFSKGPCFGKCPVFDYIILNDGIVHWNGEKNTHRVGQYICKLPQQKINELILSIQQILTENPAARYPINDQEQIADFPITWYHFSLPPTPVRSIRVNHSAPNSFKKLNALLENWLEEADWMKIEP